MLQILLAAVHQPTRLQELLLMPLIFRLMPLLTRQILVVPILLLVQIMSIMDG
jgi:hypothetical protein